MSQTYRAAMSQSMKTKSQLGYKRQKVPVEGLFCNYSHRVCMQNRLDGFEYCIKHILEDKNSPYKQCNYVSNKNGKRCHNATLKSDKKDGLCTEHAKRMALARLKSNQKKKVKETAETLLEEVEHYSSSQDLPGTSDNRRSRPSVESVTSRLLDYESSSESESEAPLVDQAWRGDCESDAESIDSEQEDLLKHAGVYTAEEVAVITRDKLIRLQSLYIDQFKRLQHVLREKRRRFLQVRKIEKETLGMVDAYKDDPDHKMSYNKLMALKRYHKRHGKEALLHRQSKERRIAASEGTSYHPPSFTKCVWTERGTKCGTRVVPLSKYCVEHILQDNHQVLFQSCSFGNNSCRRPVPATEEDFRCVLHKALIEYQNRLPIKREIQETVTAASIEENSELLAVKKENEVKIEPNSPTLQEQLNEPMDTSLSESHDIDVVGNDTKPTPSNEEVDVEDDEDRPLSSLASDDFLHKRELTPTQKT